jgi:hypothetical protein
VVVAVLRAGCDTQLEETLAWLRDASAEEIYGRLSGRTAHLPKPRGIPGFATKLEEVWAIYFCGAFGFVGEVNVLAPSTQPSPPCPPSVAC